MDDALTAFNIFMSIFLGAIGIATCGFLIYPAAYRIVHGRPLIVSRQKAKAAEQLESAGVLTRDTPERQRKSLLEQNASYANWWRLGLGSVMLFAMVVVILFLNTNPFEPTFTLNPPGAFDPTFWIMEEILSAAALVACVTSHMMRLRMGLRASPRADLPAHGARRRVRDYYSPVFWFILFAIMGIVGEMYLRVSLSSPNVIVSIFGALIHAPATLVAVTLMVGDIVILLAAALSARWIAGAPLFAVSEDRALNERWDTLIRTRAIGACGAFPLIISAQLLVNAWESLSTVLNPRGTDDIGSMIGAFVWLAVFVSYMFTVNSGRMGGRLTGWWWQRRPALREQEGVEGT